MIYLNNLNSYESLRHEANAQDTIMKQNLCFLITFYNKWCDPYMVTLMVIRVKLESKLAFIS
jgi:hypothetical protein